MRIAILGAAGLAAAVLTGCGSGETPARTSSTPVPPTSTAAAAPVPSRAPVTSGPPAAEVAVPKPPPNYCAHNTAAQLVLVRLKLQRMWLCAKSRTVYSNAITSGMLGPYTETRPGTITSRDSTGTPC